ncbi:hypothetical protein CPB85DRAFT_1326568 [Mucidula mucida]|nr:hypothetical protein CPB85DRAFT_1326568 [Mucidula mucida]
MTSEELNLQSYASTVSLQSSNTVTSTAPLTGVAPKDFSAAFGELQSRYGTSGHIPTPKSKKAPGSKQAKPAEPKATQSKVLGTSASAPAQDPPGPDVSSLPILKKKKTVLSSFKSELLLCFDKC